MSLVFEGEFESERPPEELWDYFTDIDVLASCAPGLKEINQLSPSEFEAVVSVGVGSVKPTFNVEGVVVEMEHPEKLVLQGKGKGGRKGSFEATGTMQLTETDDGTLLKWKAEGSVSGLIASLGQRALSGVTDRLANDFFECMESKIIEGVPASPDFTEVNDDDPSSD